MKRPDRQPTHAALAFPAIYAIVRRIPRGRVASYGQIARLAGLPGRARLVGRALAEAPPETGTLPWHRVINARGEFSLTAGSASGREQRRRLEKEGVQIFNGRVDLRRYGWSAGGESPLLE